MRIKILYLLYDALLLLASPFVLLYYLLRLITVRSYREGFFERLGYIENKILRNNGIGRTLWFHAVSVGEVNALAPLVKEVKRSYPDHKILISTITPTGRATARKNIPFADLLIYLPVDLPWVVKRVVREVRPVFFGVVETEIWPNLVRALKEECIPIFMVNGRLSSSSFKRYKFFRFFFKKVIDCFSFFSMQTDTDAQRIISVGAYRENVYVTGNIKYHLNGHEFKTDQLSSLRDELGIEAPCKVIVAGSTHAGEEKILLDVFCRLKGKHPLLKLIIAPRHPERFAEVENIVAKSGLKFAKRSIDRGFKEESGVLILDTIGELGAIYSIGTVAFVGGSLVDTGGHNMIEPAFHRRPVLFGHFVSNFISVAESLEDGGGAIKVKDGEELFFKLDKLLSDGELIKKMGEAAYAVVKRNKGALKKNMELIDNFLKIS